MHGSVGLDRDPRQRAFLRRLCARFVHGRTHAVLLILRHILPNDGMHQHPGGPALLRLCQFCRDEVGGVHPDEIGLSLPRFGDGSLHPFEPDRVFGPDIGFQAERLRRIGEIDRGNIAAARSHDFDRSVRWRRALPFRHERHRRTLGTDHNSAQIVAIAVEHQVDAGARTDFETLEAGRQSLLRQPQHGSDEIGRAARLIGLRRTVEPRQQARFMGLYDPCDDCSVVGRDTPIDGQELGRVSCQMQRMDPARNTQRQRIGQRCPLPAANPLDQGVAGIGSQDLDHRGHHTGSDIRPCAKTIIHLVGEGGLHRAFAFRIHVDEFVGGPFVR